MRPALRVAAAATGAALLLALAASWQQAAPTGPAAAVGDTRALHGAPGAAWPVRGPGVGAAAAAADAERLRHAADALLTPDLLHRIEALLLKAGTAATPELLKQRVTALAAQHFTPELAARAAALAGRYVDYRVALGTLKRPAPNDPEALREAMDARHRLRQRFFASEEDEALFAGQDALDRFALARLAIARDGRLSESQRAAAVQQAEQELSPAERAARTDLVAHAAVAAQTTAFEAQGTSEAQRYAQRRAQHGDAAALRLQQLDAQERDWQSRLSTYAAAQAGQAAPAELSALEARLFTPEERMRLAAALQLRSLQAAQTR